MYHTSMAWVPHVVRWYGVSCITNLVSGGARDFFKNKSCHRGMYGLIVWAVVGMIVGDSVWHRIVALGYLIWRQGNWVRRWKGRHRNFFSMFGWLFRNIFFCCCGA